MVSNNKIRPILNSIEAAAKPQKFSHVFLKKLGYSSSNDRAVIPLLKRLGFIRDDGTPTEHYNDLKDRTRRFIALAERIKALYSELYSINVEIHSQSDEEIKGAISRVTGKDATSVNRYFATFKALAQIADFSQLPANIKDEQPDDEGEDPPAPTPPPSPPVPPAPPPVSDIPSAPLIHGKASFQYNIQIHLPATTDISVYNAIFKSLKENLGL